GRRGLDGGAGAPGDDRAVVPQRHGVDGAGGDGLDAGSGDFGNGGFAVTIAAPGDDPSGDQGIALRAFDGDRGQEPGAGENDFENPFVGIVVRDSKPGAPGTAGGGGEGDIE